jgi:hypothetical protein
MLMNLKAGRPWWRWPSVRSLSGTRRGPNNRVSRLAADTALSRERGEIEEQRHDHTAVRKGIPFSLRFDMRKEAAVSALR